MFPYEDYLLVGGYTPGAFAFYEVVPRSRYAAPEAALAAIVAQNQHWVESPYTYRMTVSGELVAINPNYPADVPFLSIDGNVSAVGDRHIASAYDTSQFPLIDVQEVDEEYRFTGTHYACGIGDGLVVIDNPARNERLILDSRDPQAPRRGVVALDEQTSGCAEVFSGDFDWE